MNISILKKLKGFSKYKELEAYYERYFYNKNFKRNSKFVRYTKKVLINKMILYESSDGQSIDGNPYALFKYLLNNPDYSSFMHVWSTTNLDDDNKMIGKYKDYKNVKFVKRNSEDYIKYLAKSKYVISDSTFPNYYFRREDQIYINCWSNTPFTVIGKDDKLDIKRQGEIQRNFLNASYLIHPNEYSVNKLLSAYDVNTLVEGHIVDVGHPKVDLLLSADKSKLKNDLTLSESDNVILFAPEWNGKTDIELYGENLIRNIEFFKNELDEKYNFIVKLPSNLNEFIPDSLKSIMISNDIDINEILSIVDLLITNSSISFDFLTTRKPIIYFMDDFIKEFNSYIPLEELPGPLCYTAEDVIDSINHIRSTSKKYKNNYVQAIKKFSYNNDGNACKRTIDTVFGRSENIYKEKNYKKKILFYPGLLKINGITSSFFSLLNNIDYSNYDITVIVNYQIENKKDYEMQKLNIKKINKNANIIYMSNEFNFMSDEYYYHNYLMKNGISEEIKNNIPHDLYIREIRRIFGNTIFDIFINFGGYDRLITILFAFSNIQTKCIYLHSNMIGEYELRFETLSVTFYLYNYYDKLITVSEDSKRENSENFKVYGMNIDDKLISVNNPLDYNMIIKNSSVGILSKVNNITYYFTRFIKNDFLINLEGIVAPISNNINFISMGRLSPEKDHKKLLLALSKVLKVHSNIKLYILGDGPLYESLINFTNNLGISDNVIFTGNISNPYWLLNNCNCLILSSNHEAQPIVILEALVLGKNIISTDIVGPRGLLEGGYGKLVDNNADALAEALIMFIEQGMINKPFDYIKYNKRAMDQFYKEVCTD